MTDNPQAQARLNVKNFERGMLIDDEWMAGISKETEGFAAFVVNHSDGSVLFHQMFPNIDSALVAVNQIPRPWRYEATGGCSGDRCAEGSCKGAGCKIFTGEAKSPSSDCSSTEC